ncbi:MAG: lipoyl(octanoyl) transferase LipB [Armatimonadaceae bacterium]
MSVSETPEIVDWTGHDPVSYHEAWEWQRERVAQRQRGEVPDTLLLLTHLPVVSYGKRASPEHLLLPEPEYAARGIALVATDRGGDATYHGPGQLVGYPIFALGEGNRDLHRYVRFLEEVLIRAATDLGVAEAGRVPWHAGVWVQDRYLAALGVKVTRWVTYHGFALNVTDEVRSGFSTIVPCGVVGKEITTVAGETGQPVTVAEAAQRVAFHLPSLWNQFHHSAK